jgi:hypothetical protein
LIDPEQNSRLPLHTLEVAIARRHPTMRLLRLNTSVARFTLLTLVALLTISITVRQANALVVENMAGTTVAPADDPGWDFVTGAGSHAFVYLGDSWALSAFHVGLPNSSQFLHFGTGSYKMIPNRAFTVPNPAGSGLSALTDLRLVRINGDPGMPNFSIASTPITESTPEAQREVVIIGAGPTRAATQSHWNVQQVGGNNNDVWTEVLPPPNGTYQGYASFQSEPENDVKRWGKNRIADEDSLFGGNDGDLRGDLELGLGTGGADKRNIRSMVTRFDSPTSGGLANEAQVVGGDSGSGVFYKRDGKWELIGIVNAQLTGIKVAGQLLDGQSTANAVYGNYSTFADLSYYRDEINRIMTDSESAGYSIMGDVNLDGVVNGSTAGGVPSGDVAAFVDGWGYDNGTGKGDVTSWKNGDLNRDGKTDAADFSLMRTALNPAGGAGGLTLESLLGGAAVPEPASLVTALTGLAYFAVFRRRRR